MIRMSLLVALIIVSGLSYAQDFGKSLNHVTVVVSDFEASKKFYTETLGLEQIDAPWLPERQMFLALGEGLELHVGEVDGVEIKPNGFNHFAIAVTDLISPTKNRARSTLWELIPPLAPDPAISFCRCQVSVNSGSISQDCR